MAGATEGLKYFYVGESEAYRGSVPIKRDSFKATDNEEKTGGALLFLRSVQTALSPSSKDILKIDLPAGLSLQDIVTQVVDGYEAKKGIFQRIWECVLRCVECLLSCFSVRLVNNDVAECAESIKTTGVATSNYLPGPFRKELRGVIAFLHTLPPATARAFFREQHHAMHGLPTAAVTGALHSIPEKMPAKLCTLIAAYTPMHLEEILANQLPAFVPSDLTFPYCDPKDPSQPRALDSLSVDQLVALGNELNWYLSVLSKEYTKWVWLSPAAEQVGHPHNALFEGLSQINEYGRKESNALQAATTHCNAFFIYALNHAIAKGDHAAAVNAAMQTTNDQNSGIWLSPSKFPLAEDCFKKGKIKDALLVLSKGSTWVGVSQDKVASLVKAIEKRLLEQPLTQENVSLFLMMAHPEAKYYDFDFDLTGRNNHQVALVTAFVDKCMKTNAFVAEAIAAVKLLDRHSPHYQLLLKQIGKACLATRDIANAEAVIEKKDKNNTITQSGLSEYQSGCLSICLEIARAYCEKGQFDKAFNMIENFGSKSISDSHGKVSTPAVTEPIVLLARHLAENKRYYSGSSVRSAEDNQDTEKQFIALLTALMPEFIKNPKLHSEIGDLRFCLPDDKSRQGLADLLNTPAFAAARAVDSSYDSGDD